MGHWNLMESNLLRRMKGEYPIYLLGQGWHLPWFQEEHHLLNQEGSAHE